MLMMVMMKDREDEEWEEEEIENRSELDLPLWPISLHFLCRWPTK